MKEPDRVPEFVENRFLTSWRQAQGLSAANAPYYGAADAGRRAGDAEVGRLRRCAGQNFTTVTWFHNAMASVTRDGLGNAGSMT